MGSSSSEEVYCRFLVGLGFELGGFEGRGCFCFAFRSMFLNFEEKIFFNVFLLKWLSITRLPKQK